MFPLGIGLIVLGYAFAFSGLSQMSTGGNGVGFLQALGVKNSKGIGINTASFVQGIVPQGGFSGSASGNGNGATGATPV